METGAAARSGTAREAGFLGLTLVALLAALGVEHWVVHRGVLLPSIELSGHATPWMWGALFAPELMVAVVAGWRLRSAPLVALYAVAAAIVREAFELALARLGEPGHREAHVGVSEFAISAPLVAGAYLAVFAFASACGRDDARLDDVGRDGA
jgi:hypothetical protein